MRAVPDMRQSGRSQTDTESRGPTAGVYSRGWPRESAGRSGVSLGRLAIDRLPVGAATVDRNGQVLFANPEFSRLAGPAVGAVVGRALTDFVHPEDRELVTGWFEVEVDAPARVPLRLGSGGRWADVVADYALLEGSSSGDGLVIATDVSIQLRSESESRVRGELLDSVEAAVVASDLDGRIFEWNRGAEELWGLTRDETLGRRVEDLSDFPQDKARTDEIVESVRETGGWSGRIEAVRRDGAPIVAYSRNALIHDAQGRPSGMVSVSVDIKAQLEAERMAITARNYLNAVTDQMVEGIYVVDEKNGLTYMNAAAERLVGYTTEELAGRNLHEVIHYKHADGTLYPVEECPITAVRSGEVASHVEPEDVFVRADGSFMPVSFSASSFETPEGTSGISVVFRDISQEKAERDRVREELEEMSWVGPIRRALRDDTMLLHGQPIFDIASGEIVQQELLIRMLGEDGSPIAAGRFLPAAERYDLVAEIDRWVIPNAIEVAAALGEPVQFNLSATSIQDPATPALIEEQMAAYELDPSLVVIEFTESGQISDHAAAERFADRLAADGCALALDDFGTGYGGFTYLTHLNVSILKIDRSFVANLLTESSSQKVVKAVVGLAEEFGQTTVAEGVEDAETLERLAELGVQQAQGYHLGRPGPLTGLPANHKFLAPPGTDA